MYLFLHQFNYYLYLYYSLNRMFFKFHLMFDIFISASFYLLFIILVLFNYNLFKNTFIQFLFLFNIFVNYTAFNI